MTSTRLRASDDERQAVATRLADHLTAGRLNTSEYDDRVRQAYGATFVDEFEPLFADLPEGNSRAADPFCGMAFGRQPFVGFGAAGMRSFVGAVPNGPTIQGTRRRPSFPIIVAGLIALWTLFAVVALVVGFFPLPLLIIAIVLLVKSRRRAGEWRGPGPAHFRRDPTWANRSR